METIEAIECREQNATAAMVSINRIPGLIKSLLLMFLEETKIH